jgi:hypothetical protein
MSILLEKVAQRYAFSHYGNLILVDEPEFNESENLYVSNLRSDYPLIIQDDRLPEKRTVRVLKIDNLGSISISSDKKIIKERTSSREDIVDNLNTYFELWKQRAERIVISASSDNLVRISRFRHYFDPIDSVLISLWDNHKIFNEEIDYARSPERRKKMRLYLNLLEGLKLVRKVEDGYVEGTDFLSIRNSEKVKNENNFRNIVIAHVIRERYATLRDVFHLTILEPTIHIDNSVYLPELETGQTVYRTQNSIARDYSYYYDRRINPLDLRLTLKRLEKADAISRKGNHYYGNEELLKKMLELKKSMPEIGKQFSIRA